MSKYDRLRDWLKGSGKASARLRFSEIEAILGENLPATARRKRQWWANSGGNAQNRHVQANAWYDAGYRVETVDFERETVTFVRG